MNNSLRVRVNYGLRALALIATFVTVANLRAQETCDEEVKLLLSPTQVQAAVSSLQAGEETHGRVYFYDTTGLDLLSKGVILRMREGAEIDLTAKLRPDRGQKFITPEGKGYKCEVDLNDGVEEQSVSVQKEYATAATPKDGEEVFQLLSKKQKKLLRKSGVEIDWKSVKRIAEIQSTSWTAPAAPPLGKLSLELWKWPGGSILEVSTRVTPDGGQAAYVELRELAGKNGLALSTNQHSKTATVLGEVTASRR